MILSLIAAVSENKVIGKDNKLPRHYPADLKRFKAITKDHTIIMGRGTYESIGKPLAQRRNIVISRTKSFPGVEMFTDPEDAINMLDNELDQSDELFVIGWASLYEYFLPKADWLYLTEIKKVYEGDTYFPEYEEHFEEVERLPHEEFDFVTYRRKRIDTNRPSDSI